MCTLASLRDGTFTLDDVADMHEIIDIRAELAKDNTPDPIKRPT